jgi:hypothetical protein
MAESTTTAHKMLARAFRRMIEWNPGGVTKVIVDLVPGSSDELLPIARSQRFLFGLMLNTGAVTPEGATPGGIEEFEVIAATDGDGTGAVVVKSSDLGGGATPTLISDTLWIEVDVENIRESLSTATHVGVRAELVTATDMCTVYIEEEKIEKRADLTADDVG